MSLSTENKNIKEDKVLFFYHDDFFKLEIEKIFAETSFIKPYFTNNKNNFLTEIVKNNYSLIYLDFKIFPSFDFNQLKYIKSYGNYKYIEIIIVCDKSLDFKNLNLLIEYEVIHFFIRPLNQNLFIKKTKFFIDNFKTKIRSLNLESSLKRLVAMDNLTQTLTRVEFFYLLDFYIIKFSEEIKNFSLVLLDIDNFSSINKILGFEKADLVLKNFTKKIKILIRDNDYISRFGDDEFALLLLDIDMYSCENLLKRIIEDIKSIKIGDKIISLGVSIGATFFPQIVKNKKDLLATANEALYIAKKNKTIKYCIFDYKKNEIFQKKLFMEKELNKALLKKQIVLMYQPRYNIFSNKVVGFEILMRWNHQKLGFVSPIDFIPIAEKTEIIKDFTLYIIDKGINQLKKWHKINPNLNLGINLSMVDLSDKIHMKKIVNLVKDSKIELHNLEFEITEGIFNEKYEHLLVYLFDLKNLGIVMSLDDFGTGYSSLSRLKNLPIDILKIDRSFIFQSHKNPSDEHIIKSIIDLAHSMNLSVIAEGAELKEHIDILKNCGCKYVQGFYYSKPLFVEVIDKLLIDNL